MPTVSIYDMTGKETGKMELSDAVFGLEPNKAVMHSAVVNYLANQRQGTQSTLTRAEVRGGGKKPWKQKGTGRARQGSTRAPQWTHGGVVFAPKPRSYRVTLNKKVRQLALKSALSAKAAGSDLIVVDAITAESYKTKVMVDMLKAVGAKKKALVVLADNDSKVVGSFANIEGVKTAQTNTVNVYDILNADTLIIAKGAAEKLQEVYA